MDGELQSLTDGEVARKHLEVSAAALFFFLPSTL